MLQRSARADGATPGWTWTGAWQEETRPMEDTHPDGMPQATDAAPKSTPAPDPLDLLHFLDPLDPILRGCVSDAAAAPAPSEAEPERAGSATSDLCTAANAGSGASGGSRALGQDADALAGLWERLSNQWCDASHATARLLLDTQYRRMLD
jgi:hypothetical protein